MNTHVPFRSTKNLTTLEDKGTPTITERIRVQSLNLKRPTFYKEHEVVYLSLVMDGESALDVCR